MLGRKGGRHVWSRDTVRVGLEELVTKVCESMVRASAAEGRVKEETLELTGRCKLDEREGRTSKDRRASKDRYGQGSQRSAEKGRKRAGRKDIDAGGDRWKRLWRVQFNSASSAFRPSLAPKRRSLGDMATATSRRGPDSDSLAHNVVTPCPAGARTSCAR